MVKNKNNIISIDLNLKKRELIFYLNNICHGVAYNIPKTNDKFCLALSFGDSHEATIKKFTRYDDNIQLKSDQKEDDNQLKIFKV